jgi:molybdopterin converting factor subunit 1
VSDDESRAETIRVKVRFFAAPREALGASELEMDVLPDTTVADLVATLTDQHPILIPFTRFLNVAVNRVYVGMQTVLHDGDEVACLPPVGGG